MHREERDPHQDGFVDNAPSCEGKGPGYACSCKRAFQAVKHAGELAIRNQHEERRRLGYALLAAVVLALASGLGSVLASRMYARQAVTDSERKLCSIVILSDDTYRQTPPTTPSGKAIAKNFRDLRAALGCSPYKEKS
jgi:hypothetical protein